MGAIVGWFIFPTPCTTQQYITQNKQFFIVLQSQIKLQKPRKRDMYTLVMKMRSEFFEK
jgi:hypothetical protein